MNAIISAIIIPVATYLAGLVVNLIRKAFGTSDVIMTTILVPLLGGISTWLASLAGSELSWQLGLIVSLASVFIKKVIDGLTPVLQKMMGK